MKSRTTPRFRAFYKALPPDIRQKTREAYKLWVNDTSHPSLHFKNIGNGKPIYSVRIDRNYRAIGILKDEGVTWDWIGDHASYDRLLKGKSKF